MEKFSVLFEIKFYHEFLKGLTMKDFDLVVTKESMQVLESYQLKIKSSLGGFFVFGTTKSLKLLASIKKDEKLIFGLNNVSPSFPSVSNVLINDLGIKYYVNNLTDRMNLNSSENLHPDKFLSLDEMVPCVYPYDSISNFVESEEVSIVKEGKEIFFGNAQNVKASSVLSRDFGQLQMNQEQSDEVSNYYYCSEMLSNSFGVIEIDLGEFHQDSNWGVVYNMNFQNREVFWNYIFVSREQLELEEVKVFKGKDQFSTEPVTREILPNGKIGFRVNASKRTSLYKDYGEFRLVAELYYNEGNKRIKLPTPEAMKIKGHRNEKGEEEFYSDMYVFY